MNAETVRNLIDVALQAERQGKLAEACDTLRQAVALGDVGLLTLTARLRLGRLLIDDRQGAEAEQVLRAAREQADQAGASRLQAAAIHLLALLERQRFR